MNANEAPARKMTPSDFRLVALWVLILGYYATHRLPIYQVSPLVWSTPFLSAIFVWLWVSSRAKNALIALLTNLAMTALHLLIFAPPSLTEEVFRATLVFDLLMGFMVFLEINYSKKAGEKHGH